MKTKIGIASLALALFGCGDNVVGQTVAGRVDHGTFGSVVDEVKVLQHGVTVNEAPVTADGTFSVYVPAGTKMALHFGTTVEQLALVAPRSTGTVDLTFSVVGGGTFDLGMIRRFDQPLTRAYKHGPAGETASGECENGMDASGAVCVEDDEQQSCDGENDDGDHQDEGDNGDAESDDDGPMTSASVAGAVAEHTVPATMGCDDGNDHQNEGEEEGDH